MPPWLTWLIGLFFGGAKQAQTDQQLGRVEQQRDDAAETAKEAQNAAEVSKQVDEAGVGAAADDLDGGVPRPPDNHPNAGGV